MLYRGVLCYMVCSILQGVVFYIGVVVYMASYFIWCSILYGGVLIYMVLCVIGGVVFYTGRCVLYGEYSCIWCSILYGV